MVTVRSSWIDRVPMALRRLLELEQEAEQRFPEPAADRSQDPRDPLIAALEVIRDNAGFRVSRSLWLQTEAVEVISAEAERSEGEELRELGRWCFRQHIASQELYWTLRAQKLGFERIAAETQQLLPAFSVQRADSVRRAIREARGALERQLKSQEGVSAFYRERAFAFAAPPDPKPPEDRNE